MNRREQMIEEAVLLAARHYNDPDLSKWEPDDRDWLAQLVTAVVDTLLPQVTTVEELETLDVWAIIVDQIGYPWTSNGDGDYVSRYLTRPRSAVDLVARGPLTVAWSPS